mmetsp:Transcript_32351/g.63233  ORF Transcript_32351/g.63233 Transcript_32351/m.63233 type:complete len:229 (+) Transcript_32351:2-688(+)
MSILPFHDWAEPSPKEYSGQALRLARNFATVVTMVMEQQHKQQQRKRKTHQCAGGSNDKDYDHYDDYYRFVLFVRLDTIIATPIFEFQMVSEKGSMDLRERGFGPHDEEADIYQNENMQLVRPCLLPCLFWSLKLGCITEYPADYGTFCGDIFTNAGWFIMKTSQQAFLVNGTLDYPSDRIEDQLRASAEGTAGRAWLYTNMERGGHMENETATGLPTTIEDLVPWRP